VLVLKIVACTPMELPATNDKGVSNATDGLPKNTTHRRKLPSITRTCHQIRTEALPIFYSTAPLVVFGNDLGTLKSLRAQVWKALPHWFQLIGNDVHHLGQLTFAAALFYVDRVSYIPITLHITIAVKGGQPVVNVSPSSLAGEDVVGRVKENAKRNWIASDLETALTASMFNRSMRLRQRTPGLAAHEWNSIVEKVRRALVKMETGNTWERYTAWRARQRQLAA